MKMKLGALVISILILLVANSCKQDCKDVTCQNGGECTTGGICNCSGRWGGLYCDSLCPLGYDGNYCTTLSKTKFIRTWNASTSSSVTGTVQHPLYVTSGGGPEKIVITNFNNEGFSMIGYMSGKDKFDIVSQNATGTYTGNVNGSGRMSGENMTIDLTKQGVNYFAICNK